MLLNNLIGVVLAELRQKPQPQATHIEKQVVLFICQLSRFLQGWYQLMVQWKSEIKILNQMNIFKIQRSAKDGMGDQQQSFAFSDASGLARRLKSFECWAWARTQCLCQMHTKSEVVLMCAYKTSNPRPHVRNIQWYPLMVNPKVVHDSCSTWTWP